MMDGKQAMTPKEIRQMYREQLIKFKNVGIGNKTEFGVKVTTILTEVTKRRLSQLKLKLK